MEKNENREMKIGGVYAFQLETGAVVTGILIGVSENLVKDTVQKYYRLALNESKYIDFIDDEIVNVNIYTDEMSERIRYFKEFESNHNVRCFDSDDNLLSASVIMGNVLIRENVWDKLTEEEKREFVNQIELEDKDILELINVYVSERI